MVGYQGQLLAPSLRQLQFTCLHRHCADVVACLQALCMACPAVTLPNPTFRPIAKRSTGVERARRLCRRSGHAAGDTPRAAHLCRRPAPRCLRGEPVGVSEVRSLVFFITSCLKGVRGGRLLPLVCCRRHAGPHRRSAVRTHACTCSPTSQQRAGGSGRHHRGPGPLRGECLHQPGEEVRLRGDAHGVCV